MIHRDSHGKRVEQQRFNLPMLTFGDVAEVFQSARFDDLKIQACLRALGEEDEVHYFAGAGYAAEEDFGHAEEALEIRDLLLDETD